MKFCMVTTFFGGHSFGGDAAYVDRLCQALCRRGHEVHVYYCVDAFNAVRGNHPLREYTPPPGLHLHPLESGYGILSPLATQATGLPLFKSRALREALDAADTDVVHFHNISLVGGPGVLGLGTNRRAVRIMTAHEHWLICPMHLLWKYDRKPCDGPSCIRCSLAGKRPPQAWRYTGAIERGLRHLDALIFPSRHALEEHRRRGIGDVAPLVHLPYFLPDDWSRGIEDEEPESGGRPYLAAAGRLVAMKGFQRLIPHHAVPPRGRPADRRHRARTSRTCAPWPPDLPNVHFEGLLGGDALARLFRGARAVVVPSLFPETFGYVVLEAFAVGTPVVVHEAGGALQETGVQSGGGLGYRTDGELLLAMRRMVHDEELRAELAARGFAQRIGEWSETEHIHNYFELIGRCQAGRESEPVYRPHHVERPGPTDPRTVGRCTGERSPDAAGSGRILFPGRCWACSALACFARLVADPSGLIVDGRRPSIDFANRGDPRPLGNDVTFVFLPHHLYVANGLAEFGHPPAWDSSGFGGRPMVGNPQSGLFYPPVWIAWLVQPARLGWLTVGHLLWGGLGLYVLARGEGLGRWPATVAAGVFQASPYLLAQTFEGHYPHVWAACWFPWAFWAFAEYGRGRAVGVLALPPILAFSYLTGHPQEWFLLVIALSIWAGWDAVAWPGSGQATSPGRWSTACKLGRGSGDQSGHGRCRAGS